jgi:hypothetical protein
MRTARVGFWAWVLCLGMFAALQAPIEAAEDSYAGVWKGTWEGAGSSGSFDITFTRGTDGQLVGSVAVTTEMGNYTAKFSKTVFTGSDLESAYDYPPDAQGEVTMKGKFNQKTGTGSWSLGAKGQPAQSMVAGTWTVTRQQ